MTVIRARARHSLFAICSKNQRKGLSYNSILLTFHPPSLPVVTLVKSRERKYKVLKLRVCLYRRHNSRLISKVNDVVGAVLSSVASRSTRDIFVGAKINLSQLGFIRLWQGEYTTPHAHHSTPTAPFTVPRYIEPHFISYQCS